VMPAASHTPYLHITAPEKECGKTLLMDVLAAVAFNPLSASGITPAALIRSVDMFKPTLFLDEMDSGQNGNRELAEAIRGILNAGFKRGGFFIKCGGSDHEVIKYNAFGPKVFAGIGELPGTVASRSIIITMQRKLKTEKVKQFRDDAAAKAAAPIKATLAEWAAGVVDVLKRTEPEPIDSLSARQQDVTEPLLAIAALGGDDWTEKVRRALINLFASDCAQDTSTGVALLSDIRMIFGEAKRDAIPSRELALNLAHLDGRPWADRSNGRGLSQNDLAKELKRFGIYPRAIRIAEKTPRGYRRDDFKDAWARYCPQRPQENTTAQQPASTLTETELSSHNEQSGVAVKENAPRPHQAKTVAAVSAQRREGLAGHAY